MTFIYALGGGLGHYTRARALINTLNICGPVTLVVTQPTCGSLAGFGPELQVLSPPKAMAMNPALLRQWLMQSLKQQLCRQIVVDAFPAGLFGELCDFPFPEGVELLHVARLLRWSKYQKVLQGRLPAYHCTYVVEALTAVHHQALAGCSQTMLELTLQDPLPGPTMAIDRRDNTETPLWLIVHSGPEDEILALLALAGSMAEEEGLQPKRLLLSPVRPAQLPSDIDHIHAWPAQPWFELADRIFTACGFNSMRQLLPYRHKHVFMPMERRFDDQFLRAARARECST
ncbi:hypothetical protein [Gynuella sp.]|uniref:hypothetical protein n=1 Tax=Gynuella sp. TaxID=2969146 RepID=UPI003D148F68